jgi:hypothetical protein
MSHEPRAALSPANHRPARRPPVETSRARHYDRRPQTVHHAVNALPFQLSAYLRPASDRMSTGNTPRVPRVILLAVHGFTS